MCPQKCFPEIFALVSSSEWCPRPYKSDKGLVATEKRNYGPLALGTDMAGWYWMSVLCRGTQSSMGQWGGTQSQAQFSHL